MRVKCLISVLLISLCSTVGLAQTTKPVPKPAKPNPKVDAAKALAVQIGSEDKAASDAAVADAIKVVGRNMDGQTLGFVQYTWLPAMLKAKQYAGAADLSLAAIVARPTDAQVDTMMHLRVRALLLDGKNDEALAAAKSFYNTCGMQHTAMAIQSVAESLAAARPDDAGAGRRFRQQQAAGAMPPGTAPAAQPTTMPSAEPSPEANLLSTIKVDPKPYETAIANAAVRDGFNAMMVQGNLLLMADRTKEAREVFRRAYEIAEEKQMAIATEAVARSMRAEDGSVARANAWVISLRPPKETESASAGK